MCCSVVRCSVTTCIVVYCTLDRSSSIGRHKLWKFMCCYLKSSRGSLMAANKKSELGGEGSCDIFAMPDP